MINLKVKSKLLSFILFLLIITGISSGYVAKISTPKKSIETFSLQNFAIKKNSVIKNMNVVVVRQNELLLASLNESEKTSR